MAQDAFMAPGAFDADAEQIRRRMAFAQALQQQSAPPKGEMVGNRYVAPSWTQHASSLANALIGAGQERKAMQDFQALGERRREEGVADVGKFIDAMRGTPAQTFQPLTPNDDEGNAMPAAVKPAAGPDMVEALRIAQTSRNPMLNQAGGALLGSIMPKTAKWEKVELPNADGTKRVGWVDINSSNPEATFRTGGVAPVKNEFVNGAPVNPYTAQPAGPAIPPQANPYKDIVIPDGKGGVVVNQPLVDAKTKISAAGAAKIDARNFNTQENEQSKGYGKVLGDIRGDITRAGYEVPKKLAQLDRMEQLLSGVDGGAAAPALADIASLASSLGIKLDPKLGAKQAAEALAREMAGSLRQPGTGPMTDKDFENFLKQVPSLSKTAEGRKQIMVTMRAALQRDLELAKFQREYAKKNGGVIDDNFFDAVADFYVKNPVVNIPMPATNARGNLLNRADSIVGGKKQ